MKLDLLEWNKKERKLLFSMKDAAPSFLNLIRRFAMDEVPTLAVEEVEFKDNSSALYDEIAAHRLGLIPIKTDLSSYRLPQSQEEIDEKSARCTLTLTLKASKKGVITASEVTSADPKCTFVYENMPIVKLAAKQKIEFEATAVVGVGKEHVKWSPGLVFFKNKVSVNTDKVSLSDEQKEHLQKTCSDIVTVGSKVKVDATKINTGSHAGACLGILEKAGAQLTYDDNDYIVAVEGWGQLTCKEMLEQAAIAIVNKLDVLEKSIS